MTRGEIAYDGTVWPVEGSVAARQYICPFGFSPSALEDRFAALCTARSYAQLVRQRGVAALARGLRSRL